MKEVDFKLTDELKDILSDVYKFSIELRLLDMSFDAVIYFIVRKYLYAHKNTVDSKLIYQEFSLMDPDKKISLEKDLYSIASRKSKTIDSIPAELIPTKLSFDLDLKVAFDKAEESIRLRKV